MAVVPVDSEAWRLLSEHLLDHASTPRLGSPLRLDDDQVSRLCRHSLLTSPRDWKPDSNSAIVPTGGRFAGATEDLTRVLDEAGPRYELLPHARTESAVAEAKASSIASADVAKTLVRTTPGGHRARKLALGGVLDSCMS
jgi:hypothetical protein